MPARKPPPKPPQDDPEQSKRFIDMAREVGVNEDPKAFERALDKIIKPAASKATDHKHSRTGGSER